MPALTPEERLRRIAATLDAVPPARHRSRVRRGAGARRLAPAAVALLVALTGTAAATGVLDHEAKRAFGPNQTRLPGGRTADAGRAELVVSAQTPDGGPVQVWEAPLQGAGGGICIALVTDFSADPKSRDWKSRFAPGASCATGDPGQPLTDAVSSYWISRTGEPYMAETASAGDAARVEYRLGDGRTLAATPQHGRYLVFVPYALWERRHRVVALDAAGRELATRLDPGSAGTPG
jgi:hypothetical protein